MKNNPNKKQLTLDQMHELLGTLKTRFEKNMNRHKGLAWPNVMTKLETLSEKQKNEKLWSLNEMEASGGEPDIVGYDKKADAYIFFDCSAESPKGRRSICYDHEALESRKENKPADSAIEMATNMGIDILNEAQYRQLQQLGNFDAKTSSWILTPADIRKRGGAIFCDYRYGNVFVYHNGAESYYAARGFRCSLSI